MSWTTCLSYKIEALTATEKGLFKEAAIEKCCKAPGSLAMNELILEPSQAFAHLFDKPEFDNHGVWNYETVYIWMFAAYSDLPWGPCEGRANLKSSWLEDPYRLSRRDALWVAVLTQLQILGHYWRNSVSLLDSFHQNFRSSLSFHAILSVLNALPCLPPFFFSVKSSPISVPPNKRHKLSPRQTSSSWKVLEEHSAHSPFCVYLLLLCIGACVKVRRWLAAVGPTTVLPCRFQGLNSSCQASE